MRCHGDYDLRQVLCTDGDVTLIDFAGVPARLLEERQLKRCPLYDVAGMLRSFHYAAYAMRWHQAVPPRTAPRPAAARLEHWTRFWCAWVSAEFVRA
jgi:maltose alpha-D-glucosyltransferase/alpha-amylase